MQFKLLGGHYLDRSEFRQDLKLVVANAEAYNVAGIVVDQAHELDAIFEKQWSRVLKTLEGLSYKQNQSNGHDYAHNSSPFISNKISIPAQSSRYRSPSPPPPPPVATVSTDNFYQPPPPPSAPKPIIKLRFAAPQPPSQPTPPPVALPVPTPPIQDSPLVASPLPMVEAPAPAPPAPTPTFKFKIKPLAPLPPPVVAESPVIVAPTPSLPSTVEPVQPILPPPAPPILPPPAIKSSGFKIKFNTSSSYSTPPPPPKPVKVHKPPKIQSFEEDIDEMFTAPKPKPMSISISSSSNGTPSSHKKKVVSYVDEPSPPLIQEEYVEPVYNLPGRPAILNEPPLPLPSTWFPEDEPINYKKAKAVLKKIGELPESFFFRLPVEAVGGLVM